LKGWSIPSVQNLAFSFNPLLIDTSALVISQPQSNTQVTFEVFHHYTMARPAETDMTTSQGNAALVNITFTLIGRANAVNFNPAAPVRSWTMIGTTHLDFIYYYGGSTDGILASPTISMLYHN
jgi:hypothetical protein